MRKKALMAAAICFLFSGQIFAWDDVGHKITGYIAWQRMAPAAREKVIRLLRSAPEDSHLSAFYMGFGPRSEAEKQLDYFSFVPTWADVVRDRAFPVRYAKYHKSTWHYSDTFWRQVNGKAELITDKQPGGQGVVKLVEFDKTMRDANVPDPEKSLALAWFLHLGGDLHQPLHTSGRHTDREPEGDQGGNLFLISPEGSTGADRVNLHWFWDSIVGRNDPYREGRCESEYIKDIAESMMLRHPYATRSGSLMLGQYSDWQKESFAFASTDVFREDLKRFSAPSDDYLRNSYRVAEARLALAGYRMGETLNNIFGK